MSQTDDNKKEYESCFDCPLWVSSQEDIMTTENIAKSLAREEFKNEIFKAKVNQYKEKLRNKKSIWKRLFPFLKFSIKITVNKE